MTAQEVKQKIIDLGITPAQFQYGDFDREKVKLSLGNYKEVYETGGEGQGDYIESVWFFEEHDTYISIAGSYDSWEGSDYSNSTFDIVRPQEKTIIVYE